MANQSSAENPWPVRVVAQKIAGWINRLGNVWVQGQVTQISARPGTQTAFLTLRDPSADVSMSITCPRELIQQIQPPLRDGTSVLIHAKPTFFLSRGSISLRAQEIRAVGIGELLARIELLRKELLREGLFSPARKQKIPFLPKKIGLVTGRASAAEHDVLVNARSRWPSADFAIVNVAVQGPQAVPQILDALSVLERNPQVDVVVVARGGGSVEDLLPFSDERLCRAVASMRTPVISAIGHEPDSPLLDHVADLRCSTPTDAGKRVVPDIKEETERITQLQQRARRALHGWVDTQARLLNQLRSRPVLADPLGPIHRRREEIELLQERGRRSIRALLSSEHTTLTAACSRLTTLGPAATLSRGYAVVQYADAEGKLHVLHSTEDIVEGTPLRIRVTNGAIHTIVHNVRIENDAISTSTAQEHGK